MEKWYLICGLLCLVGVLKEFRPSEPYVTKFLVKYKNVTRDEVSIGNWSKDFHYFVLALHNINFFPSFKAGKV